MATVRDLYEILGVGRDASTEDIRTAYRRLAREFHPDVNADPEAEQRFKEVAGAYEILSDADKRARYDAFGDGGPMQMPFGDISDLFEAFFGAGTFGQRRGGRRSRSEHGEDLFADLALGFKEAAFGVRREVEIGRMEMCEVCRGSGAQPGTSPQRCHTCGGSGQVQDVRRSIFGTVMTARTCGTCRGTGEEIVSPCERAGGGAAWRHRRPSRSTSRPASPTGWSSGSAAPVTPVAPGDHRATSTSRSTWRRTRCSSDTARTCSRCSRCRWSRRRSAARSRSTTLDGTERVGIDPGTESGTTVRLRGKGIPNLGRGGRGDLFLTIAVQTPRDLSKEQRRLVEELARLRGEAAGKREHRRGTLRRPGTQGDELEQLSVLPSRRG